MLFPLGFLIALGAILRASLWFRCRATIERGLRDRVRTATSGVPADDRGDRLSPAGPPRPAAELHLAEIRPGARLSRTPALPRILEPQHRGQAAFGECEAEQPQHPEPGPPRQAFALAALKPRPAARRLFAAAGGAALSGRVIGIT